MSFFGLPAAVTTWKFRLPELQRVQCSHLQKGTVQGAGSQLNTYLDDAGVRTVSGDTLVLIQDRVQLVNRLAVEKNLTSAS